MSRLFLPLAILLLAGCLRAPEPFDPPQSLRHIEGIPYREQNGRDDCGAAVLSSLLAYRGLERSVAEIDAEIRHPKLGGALLADMENYAQREGFSARSGRGTRDLLRHEIDASRPVVIPVKSAPTILARSHYILLYGYGREIFLALDPRRGPFYITSSDLDSAWGRMNRLYLVLE